MIESYYYRIESIDPAAVLKLRLAKGEITPEQYEQSVKLLQGQG